MYTNIILLDLLQNMKKLIGWVFNYGNRTSLRFSKDCERCYWNYVGSTRTDIIGSGVTQEQLYAVVELVVTNNYCVIAGHIIVVQIVGLPMGIAPAPSLANLQENKKIYCY